MTDYALLFFPILLPLTVAVLMGFLRKKPAAMAWTILATVLVSFLGIAGLLLKGQSGYDLSWVGDFKITLVLTPFKAMLLGFVALFMVLNGLYLTRFLEKVGRPWLYASFTLVAMAAACSVVLSQNVLVLLIGWELFLASLYALILSGGTKAEPVAFKALMIGGASDFLMILGLMVYLSLGGPLSMAGAPIPTDGSFAALASFFLLFLGAGAKAGMWPFQTWIPEAAEVMPAPAFAALPASMEKLLGVTFLFALVKEMFVLGHTAQMIMFVFALVTVFASVIPALVEKNFKKVLAFTAISPVGFMVAGLATSTAIGMAGALMYMLTHATYKSAMFYAAGNLEAAAGGATLEAIEARPTRNTLTVVGYAGAFLAAVSFLFTGGFLAKEAILEGTIHHHFFGVFALLVLGAILNVAVMVKLLRLLLSGICAKAPSQDHAFQVLPVLVLGVLALVGGGLFLVAGPLFDTVTGGEISHALAHGLTHFYTSPLFIASLLIWVVGVALAFNGRPEGASVAATFDGLRTSMLLGRAYERADAKGFDAYEGFIKGVNGLAQFVFLRLERNIDVFGLWVIRTGGAFFRATISGAHTGIYSTYLSWVFIGFALVAWLVLLR